MMMELVIKNLADYKDIWTQTEKAFNYLRRKGCTHYVESIHTSFGGTALLAYYIGGADDKAKRHVAKTYPRALVSYISEEEIRDEQRRRKEDFDRKREKNQTEHAVYYLNYNGCDVYRNLMVKRTNGVISTVQKEGDPIKYVVVGATQKMIQHVENNWPFASVKYADSYHDEVHEELGGCFSSKV